MDDLVGHVFGNYRLIRLLGRGGFARVYLGEHVHLQTQAAIKVLSTQLVEKDLERFRREARTVASLDHPHIVRVFDFGIEQDIPFLVMNYASQGTVQQRHAKESRLPLDTVLRYVQQIAPALQYAHDRKIIHRDVKPENMLVGNQGELLLSDFGIAATTATSTSQQTKTTAGTAAYMAPEQIMGKPCVASDQYALGIVVYTWLCGETPFQGSFFEICAQHMHAPVPSFRQKNPDIPIEVEQCVLKALAKDPEQRFACVQDFATALLEGAQQTGQTTTATLQSPGQYTDPDVTYIKSIPVAAAISTQDASTYVKTPLADLSDTGQSAPTIAATSTQDDSTYVKTPPVELPNASQDASTYVKTPSADLSSSHPINTDPVVQVPVTPQPFVILPNPKRKRRSVALVAFLCVLIVALVGSGLAYILASRSSGAGVSGNRPTGPITATSATVTITPASTDVQKNYHIMALTGTPDAGLHQVAARIISATTQTQTRTVNATGSGQSPGASASGTLLFRNYSTSPYTLPAGTVLSNDGSPSIHMRLDSAVAIPASPGAATGDVDAPAHVVEVGTIGNIPLVNPDGSSPFMCQTCSHNWIVSNKSAFTGGVDPVSYTFVQQSDINNAVQSLGQPDATQTLQGQIHANEHLVGTPTCTPHVQSDHNAGDQATSVTVTVSFTCTGEVYDQDGALAVATQWLKDDTAKSLGTGYALVGQVKTSQLQASIADASQGTVAISVTAEGIWAYQFSDAQKTQLAQLLAGKKKSDAQALLQGQQGIKQADIQLSGNSTLLPTDPRQITITIESISGL